MESRCQLNEASFFKGEIKIENAYAAAIHKIFGQYLNRFYFKLYEYFGSWQKMWESAEYPVSSAISPEVWQRFQSEKKTLDPGRVIEEMLQRRIGMITRTQPEFSNLLLQISDIPCILYYCGDIALLNQDSLAIVGARKASFYGLRQAKLMAAELSGHNLVITSGMARGIDAAAHEGTLEAGGKTIAVLGSGLDIPYPRENLALFKQICEAGLVISEYPLGTQPLPRNFPIRNRIISGISNGVFVVEAQAKSGSLITCDFALEQGKEVFALPGPVNNPASIGTLRLIQNGAKLVIYAEDILEELGRGIDNALFVQRKNQTAKINLEEKGILNQLYWEPVHIDTLIEKLKNPELFTILLNLELKGLIKELPGKYYVRL